MSLLGRAARAGRTVAASLQSSSRRDHALSEASALMQAEILARDNDRREVSSIDEVEYRVYSQFGDDGILQYLTRKLKPVTTFVEIAVADYVEASTRLLLVKDNWRGLVVDSSAENVSWIRSSDLYWRHDLTAVESFVTVENVNDLVADNGFEGDVGVLVIDIDGNDYWVWKALDAIAPAVVGVEYNSVFGPHRSVVVPYSPSFHRTAAHWSNLYWGASIAALSDLAEASGYRLVGSNSAGNNAYFVRTDLAGGLPTPRASEAWRESRFRESRDAGGALTYLAGSQRLAAIADMPLVDVRTGEELTAGDLRSK
jgi:hypothetical protein